MKNTLEAKLAYRENAVRGATPIELVVILFDAAIHDMRRAESAIQARDIEGRALAIRHVLLILQQLQGTLDFERAVRSPDSSNSFTTSFGQKCWKHSCAALRT